MDEAIGTPTTSHTHARGLVLAATSVGSALAFLDVSVVNVALPAMRRDLGLGLAGQQWTVLAYTLALASLLLAAGTVADRVGLARGFVVGTSAFALSSLFVGAAPGVAVLLIARAAQGASAAVLTSTSLALLRVTWAAEAGRAIGLWTSLTSGAIVAGPALGGIVVEAVSWRWIFLINVPLAAVALVLLGLATRRSRRELTSSANADASSTGASAPDVWSLAFATFAVALAVSGLVEWRTIGAGWSCALFAGSAACAALVELRRRRGARPLIPGDLLRVRAFWVANTATLFIYGALGASGFFASIYLQAPAVGYSPLEAGLVQLPSSILLVLLAPTFGRLADRHGPRRYLVAGPLLLAASALCLATVHGTVLDVDTSPFRVSVINGGIDGLLPGMVLSGLGLAVFVAPITATALRAARADQAGVASAVSNLAARLGTLLAIAVLGLAASATFASGHEPFASSNVGAALLADDRSAWHLAMFGCAALAIGGALISALGLRGVSFASTSTDSETG